MAKLPDSGGEKRPPHLTIRRGAISLGDGMLFENADISIGPGDKTCLVGRNGSGKSSLMRALSGEIALDSGDRFVQPGVRIAYLPQDPKMPPDKTVRAHVADALPPAEHDAPQEHLVDEILVRLRLDANVAPNTLSGGEARRVALARAMISKPDVLLLDEPTNHLDLPTIEWLEEELRRFRGGLLLISHDRAFLNTLTNRTYWIDRAETRRLNSGFAAFGEWADKVLADEEMQRRKLDKRIAEETRWLREGLTARRARNEGRVRSLMAMRKDKAEHLKPTGAVNMSLGDAERGAQLVIEAMHISKSFTDPSGREKVIAKEFSSLIRRKDRIGLIGPNGAGKTTLLKMLLGLEKPDRGRVRVGFGVEPVYFDQRRDSLNPDDTLWSTLAPGGADTVFVHGKPKHVVSYLRDFLFLERQAHTRVKNLSGGERNRLLLAKLFAQPHNLLVLDEPTNDLDIETLDLLQETLADYDGTIIVVSHDRDFLDRVVSSIIAVEGDGDIQEYPGGYQDYLQQRPQSDQVTTAKRDTDADKPEARPKNKSTKLSYKDQRELDMLPSNIDKLQSEIAKLEDRLADPDLFTRAPDEFTKLSEKLTGAQQTLAESEDRWLELEAMREELEAVAG